MKIAFGIKTHSGWAALVAIGGTKDDIAVVDRRRLELVDEMWAKQPYHAAQSLRSSEARAVVKRGIDAARRLATRELRAAMEREGQRGNAVIACAVIVGKPMPAWSTDQILAVHFRMHKAEGVLFQDALLHAGSRCRLRQLAVPEGDLVKLATQALGMSGGRLEKQIAILGKSLGPPWGKDQKDAALAACIAVAPAATRR
jgi:hypothetical protein